MINQSKKQAIFNKAIIFSFCSIFMTIFLGQIFGITSANDLIERKEIAPFPVLSLENKKMIPELNAYLSDNFGFRNILLKLYFFLKLNLLRGKVEAVSSLAYEEAYNHILYTPQELEAWKNFLERERKHVEAQNIRYFLVVIPEKSLIYKNGYDNTISYLRHYDFVNYIRKNSSIEIVDPTDSLIKAKDEFPLYYKTDTHWTNYGAYIAYLDVMKYINKYKPHIETYQREDFDIFLEKYDIWLGDSGLNYPGYPNRPDYGVKFTLKNNSASKQLKLGAILEYVDSYSDIQRRVCVVCLLRKFPTLKYVIPLLFVQPTVDKADRDPNPEYWFPKDRIENLIPIIRKNVLDKQLQDRFINYLMIQGLLPDRVGLDYFLRLNFNKIINRDIELKLDQSLIDEYKPDFVMREVTDDRIQHGFNRVKCFYDKDENFNSLHLEDC